MIDCSRTQKRVLSEAFYAKKAMAKNDTQNLAQLAYSPGQAQHATPVLHG